MNKALETTANALAITSSLLAIGIELGIIGGGYYLYKKYLAEPKKEENAAVSMASENGEADIVERVPYPPKQSVGDRIRKAGSIIKAVLA